MKKLDTEKVVEVVMEGKREREKRERERGKGKRERDKMKRFFFFFFCERNEEAGYREGDGEVVILGKVVCLKEIARKLENNKLF